MEGTIPALAAATGRARPAAFRLSCEPAAGRLLAVLAAHLPVDARVPEPGYWRGGRHCLDPLWAAARSDVTVTTIEKDSQTAALAARGDWPHFVDLRVGDALGVLGETRACDLIFADAQGGKWAGLDRTIAALRPHGLLVVDDMTATPLWTPEQHTKQGEERQTLLESPLLTSIELDNGSGIILATRHA